MHPYSTSAPLSPIAIVNHIDGNHGFLLFHSTCNYFIGTGVVTLPGTQAPGSDKRVAVLCHGFASTRQSFHLPEIAQRLARKSVASLRFDFAGNGDSEGTFEFGNYAMEAEDIRAAVLFLRERGLTVTALVGAPSLCLPPWRPPSAARCRACPCVTPRRHCRWLATALHRCHRRALAGCACRAQQGRQQRAAVRVDL